MLAASMQRCSLCRSHMLSLIPPQTVVSAALAFFALRPGKGWMRRKQPAAAVADMEEGKSSSTHGDAAACDLPSMPLDEPSDHGLHSAAPALLPAATSSALAAAAAPASVQPKATVGQAADQETSALPASYIAIRGNSASDDLIPLPPAPIHADAMAVASGTAASSPATSAPASTAPNSQLAVLGDPVLSFIDSALASRAREPQPWSLGSSGSSGSGGVTRTSSAALDSDVRPFEVQWTES